MDRIYPESGGSELSEYQIRFLLSCMVRPQISIEIDLFLRILAHLSRLIPIFAKTLWKLADDAP